MNQNAGNAQPLFHATGEAIHQCIALVTQVGEFQNIDDEKTDAIRRALRLFTAATDGKKGFRKTGTACPRNGVRQSLPC